MGPITTAGAGSKRSVPVWGLGPTLGLAALGPLPLNAQPQRNAELTQTSEGEGKVEDESRKASPITPASPTVKSEAPHEHHPPSSDVCCRKCGSTEVIVRVSRLVGLKQGQTMQVAWRLTLLICVTRPQAPGAAPSATGGRNLRPVATCKLLIVGNAKCGKSSLIRRFVDDTFNRVSGLLGFCGSQPALACTGGVASVHLGSTASRNWAFELRLFAPHVDIGLFEHDRGGLPEEGRAAE